VTVLRSNDGETRVDGLRVRWRRVAIPLLKKVRNFWKDHRASNLDGFFETKYAAELNEKKQDEDGKK
jgi:hypothetical protein